MKKKGFTLVELLAVIVILAVILIIAIPQIMNTIKTTRLKTMEDSAKLIATNAEKDYLSQQAINQNYKATSIPCTDVAKLSDDYSSCSITYDSNGVSTVKLKGANGGKFSGITCTGTKDNMNCRNIELAGSIYALGMPAVTNLTYNINYDKCMEVMAETALLDSDKELFCSGQTTSQGFNLEEILDEDRYAVEAGENEFVKEGAVTVNYEYEQITDYNSLNSNVFIKLPKGESRYDNSTPKSVCIKYQGNTSNEINCFEYDNYEYEKQHLADVFGKDKCTGNDVGSLALKDSFLNKILGIEKVYAYQQPYYVHATDGMYECEVNANGFVECTYDGEGYAIDPMGKVMTSSSKPSMPGSGNAQECMHNPNGPGCL
ncbi:MAG: prepilin-type N-terminal cleavage/methylation domain-containing protein [Bacilli bacterium]|nr:prepilin-type N-terminal cleavage/methylation domain-containing protein [Bacilli bacterium]